MYKIFALISLIISSITLVKAQENEQLEPPKPKKTDHYIVTHGDSIYQPYYWMREKNSPELINYLYEENAYTEAQLKSNKLLQKKIFEELRARIKETNASKPERIGDYSE